VESGLFVLLVWLTPSASVIFQIWIALCKICFSPFSYDKSL
jgi:hypothetical protein